VGLVFYQPKFVSNHMQQTYIVPHITNLHLSIEPSSIECLMALLHYSYKPYMHPFSTNIWDGDKNTFWYDLIILSKISRKGGDC